MFSNVIILHALKCIRNAVHTIRTEILFMPKRSQDFYNFHKIQSLFFKKLQGIWQLL